MQFDIFKVFSFYSQKTIDYLSNKFLFIYDLLLTVKMNTLVYVFKTVYLVTSYGIPSVFSIR